MRFMTFLLDMNANKFNATFIIPFPLKRCVKLSSTHANLMGFCNGLLISRRHCLELIFIFMGAGYLGNYESFCCHNKNHPVAKLVEKSNNRQLSVFRENFYGFRTKILHGIFFLE